MAVLEMSSEHVGAKSRILEVEITPRRIMNYAAGISDDNPRYFDDERKDGIVAPPMMAVALTWPITKDIATHWEEGAFPIHVMRQQVHYTETLIWNRTIHPGDRIKVQGQIIAILKRRGGVYFVVKYTGHDADNVLVFTEFIGGFLRMVRCVGGDRGAENLPVIETLPDNPGVAWEEDIDIHPLAAHVYDACSDIDFPIHTSIRFARSVGLSEPILHGTATLSIALRELTNRECGGDPNLLRELNCRFTGMVVPGARIRLHVFPPNEHAGVKTVFFDVVDAQGKKVISDAYVKIGAP